MQPVQESEILRRGRFYSGVSARVSRQLRLSRTHVWCVLMGYRRSVRVEKALAAEIERVEGEIAERSGKSS